MASLPAEQRRQMAEAALAEAFQLMDDGQDVAADEVLRHTVHEGAWATDMIRAALTLRGGGG